jgi:hypothetical protein
VRRDVEGLGEEEEGMWRDVPAVSTRIINTYIHACVCVCVCVCVCACV